MRSAAWRWDSVSVTAMIAAALVSAQFVAGRASRDALYLAHLDVTSLPVVVVVASLLSIALALAISRVMRRTSTSTLVPAAFAASTGLFVLEWVLLRTTPRPAVVLLYLHVSGLGPLLGSGLWLAIAERFDPRAARTAFARIAAAGTLGGVIGGVLADRVTSVLGLEETLLFLAVLSVLSAWQLRRLSMTNGGDAPHAEQWSNLTQSTFGALSAQRYLRTLSAFVLLGTIAAALLDYTLKAQAVATLGRGDNLLRFFSIFYVGVSLAAFLLQISTTRFALERLGLARTSATPSLAVIVAGGAALVAPGLVTAIVARAAESLLRASLFRAAYEVFYTPLAVKERRVIKSIVDVAVDRVGEMIGGGLVALVLLVAVVDGQQAIIFGLAVACSIGAVVTARRLTAGYLTALERALRDRVVAVPMSDIRDRDTRTVVLQTLGANPEHAAADERPASAEASARPRDLDAVTLQILALRSGDRERVLRVLDPDNRIAGDLTSHIIPLLAWDPVAPHAIRALRSIVDRRVGELVDALLDAGQPAVVRRRLARVLAASSSRRAIDGLLEALNDDRFEVRAQCGRSLVAIHQREPALVIHEARVFASLREELARGRTVWESHRDLAAVDDDEPRSPLQEHLHDRVHQALAHAFTLLSLVLPAEPVRVAYRALHVDDRSLRGIALEYLEGVLPPDVCEGLWPLLDERRAHHRLERPRHEVVATLLRSHPTIVERLERRVPPRQ